MYVDLHRNGIGDFGNNLFWSSSQYGSDSYDAWNGGYGNGGAWSQNFANGDRHGIFKNSTTDGWPPGSYHDYPHSVRAVRAF